MPDTGATHGPTFYEEPGERGPLTYPEILTAHKAFKMAAAGMIERPRGVSRQTWQAACDFAEDVTPGLCWLLGHLGGPGGRMLDLLVRSAGPVTGGLPEAGPEDFPPIYQTLLVPPGACPRCGINHKAELPHDMTPVYQQWFFSQYGRRPTLSDSFAHCTEPIQALMVSFWSGVGCWPVVPAGWVPPNWFRSKLEVTMSQCVRYLK